MAPLDDIRVLDFTTLLPGPFATLILAEAGAEVIKVERPGGEDMRNQAPKFGETGMLFSLLNRGKKSIEIDLKRPGAVETLTPLIESSDVLIEQFRPGVMERLGLGWEAARAINPRLVYCSITGYGQSGPKVRDAGHDLNYCADTGVLSTTRAADGAPVLPLTQLADIGAGSYPAVMNIMFALWERNRSGAGRYLDISMTDNLFPFAWMGLGLAQATGAWPLGGDLVLTGASPRYQIYRAADGAYLTVGALEQKFWDIFCDGLEMAPEFRDDIRDPPATLAEVARLVGQKPGEYWTRQFAGKDACAVVMRSLEEAFNDTHYRGRGIFRQTLANGGLNVAALPVPLAPTFNETDKQSGCPTLGGAEALLVEPR